MQATEGSRKFLRHYLNSFIAPLIDETRANLCSGIESVSRALACEIMSLEVGKGYKPPEKLCYDIQTQKIADLTYYNGLYEPEAGDLIAVIKVRPKFMGI
ncbi:hypothetical protein Ancab_002494 [Ancistrocladus abbreviatus]